MEPIRTFAKETLASITEIASNTWKAIKNAISNTRVDTPEVTKAKIDQSKLDNIKNIINDMKHSSAKDSDFGNRNYIVKCYVDNKDLRGEIHNLLAPEVHTFHRLINIAAGEMAINSSGPMGHLRTGEDIIFGLICRASKMDIDDEKIDKMSSRLNHLNLEVATKMKEIFPEYI